MTQDLEALKEHQYRLGEINNHPAGTRTEKPVINLPGVASQETLRPEQIETSLAQDRRELVQVAENLSARVNRHVSSVEAAIILAERMQDLVLKANEATFKINELRKEQGSMLGALMRGVPVNPQSLGQRFKRSLRSAFSDSKGQFEHAEERRFVVVNGVTYDQDSRARVSPEQELIRQRAKDVLKTWRSMDYGNEVSAADREKMNRFFEEFGIPTGSDQTILEPGLRIDPVLCSLSIIGRRKLGDMVMTVETENGQSELLRLNSLVIRLADYGIYQKGDSPDVQQCAYPSSPLRFYNQCVKGLEAEAINELAFQAAKQAIRQGWAQEPRNAPGYQSNISPDSHE